MLDFVTEDRQSPQTRPSEARTRDFREITPPFSPIQLKQQASRCAQCGVPFCQTSGCPLQNNIPDWLMLTAEGRLEEAYHGAAATNTLPEICGRICPQDRLCEKSCVLEQSEHGAVTIGSVEKQITDLAWEQGWVKPIAPVKELSQSIGIIGSGPAALACAEQLRHQGYQVHVYERSDRIGGLLTYGIPGFKLEKEIVLRRVKWLEDSKVKFHANTAIGTGKVQAELPFAELRSRHDALLIATGVYKAREIGLPVAGAANYVPALDYLTASNRVNLGDTVPAFSDGTLDARGKRVVVIGGGDTAMDCVRTAVRQGATQVSCLYRRDRENMPGSQREVKYAEEEGVEFEWLAVPTGFESANGRLTAVRAVRTKLGVADAQGRRRPVTIPGSEFRIEADLVIPALGFEPEELPTLFGEPALEVTSSGTLSVSPKFETGLEGVFAAGDIVRGASLVVWAIQEGRRAAEGIHHYLSRRRN